MERLRHVLSSEIAFVGSVVSFWICVLAYVAVSYVPLHLLV